MRHLIARAFVYLGGALFVVSLLSTGWLYLVVFGRQNRGPLLPAAAIDLVLLAVFALHHSFFARPSVKAFVARIVSEPLVRSCYVWVASLLLLAVALWWEPVGGTVYRFDDGLGWLFVTVQLAGLALIVRAVRAIRALELAGIEPPRPADDLQITGPYRLVRHPLYLGWVLAVGAPRHMTGDRLLFALATTVYIAIAIPWEERGLVAAFGGAYRRYRETVRWRLIPGIY